MLDWIWKNSKQSGHGLNLMLAIGDFADEEGRAYPSVNTLATKARVSERTVQRLLKAIEADGELRVYRGAGPRRCHVYRVLLDGRGDKLSGVTACRGDKARGGGDKPCKGGVTRVSPDPSEEIRHLDPSEEKIPIPSGSGDGKRRSAKRTSTRKQESKDPVNTAARELAIHLFDESARVFGSKPTGGVPAAIGVARSLLKRLGGEPNEVLVEAKLVCTYWLGERNSDGIGVT